MIRCHAFLILVLAAPSVALAQHSDTLSIGTRIRATTIRGQSRLVGTMAGFRGDTVFVSTRWGALVAIPLTNLDMLEVSTGRRAHTLEGMGLGVLVGAALGAAIGAATTQDEFLGPGFFALLGAGVGAAGGLVIGGAIGASVQTDRWGAAPGWELNLSVRPDIRGVGLSLKF